MLMGQGLINGIKTLTVEGQGCQQTIIRRVGGINNK